jgi:hypothetical protein
MCTQDTAYGVDSNATKMSNIFLSSECLPCNRDLCDCCYDYYANNITSMSTYTHPLLAYPIRPNASSDATIPNARQTPHPALIAAVHFCSSCLNPCQQRFETHYLSVLTCQNEVASLEPVQETFDASYPSVP